MGSFMSPGRLISAVAILLIWTGAASAGIRPSFMEDHAAWNATDIVVVTPTGQENSFEVLQTIKGDLAIRSQLSIPDFDVPERSPQMILFLKRTSDSDRANGALIHWIPADLFGKYMTSTVWIEGDRAYCYIQELNPGPSRYMDCLPASELRERIDRVLQIQQQLTDISNNQDLLARGRNLADFLRRNEKEVPRSRIWVAREYALQQIANCGAEALPEVRKLLDDPNLATISDEVAEIYIKSGGTRIAKELEIRIASELEYWKSTAPRLSDNWVIEDTNNGTPIRSRFFVTLRYVQALRKLKDRSALPKITELRDFWRSIPQLKEFQNLSQECDRAIRELQAN